ncbi:MAG TPA: ABC transporter permease [Candidatus Angelobacter sp.]
MSLRTDITLGFRAVKRSPAFALTVVIVLGFAICANVLVFQLIAVVMLRTLPVENPRDLVVLKWTTTQELPQSLRTQWSGFEENTSFSYAAFTSMAKSNTLLSLFGFAAVNPVVLKTNLGETSAAGEAVTGKYFSGLGVRPQLGRLITEEDSKPGASPVIVLNYAFWAREFGKDSAVVGKTLIFHHVPYTVIGVADHGFAGTELGQSPDFWVSVEQWNETQVLLFNNTIWGLTVMGRLPHHADLGRAGPELEGLFQEALTANSSAVSRREDLPHLTLVSGARGVDLLKERFSRPALSLMLLGSLVFVISCANVAILILNRAFARRRELAVLVSLGAPRSSLIGRSLFESFIIAILGAATGLLLVFTFNSSLDSVMAGLEPFIGFRIPFATPDLVVVAFAAALTVLAGMACGIIPAWYASRKQAASVLRDRDPDLGGVRKFKVREILLVLQAAASIVLVMVAGLLVKTLENLQHQDLGFDPHNVVLFSVNASKNGYRGAALMDVYSRLQERLQSVPGAISVSCSSATLASASEFGMPVSIPAHPERSEETPGVVELVGPNFFRTMGIRVLQGRDLVWDDLRSPRKVAVVNEAMAHHFFPDGHPVGQTFVLSNIYSFEVAGVVGNGKGHDLRDDPTPRMYLPYPAMVTMLTAASDGLFFEVRTTADLGFVVPGIRGAVREVDPNLVVRNIATQMQQVSDSVVPERVLAGLSSSFALLVLILTSMSVYATQSHSVVQRTREIGIRLSLGSSRGAIIWFILRRGLLVVFLGTAVGLVLATSVTRFLASQLYGVKPVDLSTAAIAMLVIVIISLFGSFLPARRGAWLNPSAALRHE